MKEFGAWLREKREQKNMTVNQLALYSGVSASLISRIENGRRGIPKPNTIKKLSDALGVSYEEVMSIAGYSEKSDTTESKIDKPSSRDKKDLKKFLEQSEVMFDGVPVSEESRDKVRAMLEGFFWEAKQMNKRKKKKEDDEK